MQATLGILSDDYSASAPIESDRWAATDRGWLYDYAFGNWPVGNYVDYAPCGPHHAEHPEGAVHAVVTPYRYHPETGSIWRYLGETRWCRDVDDAKAWIADAWRRLQRRDSSLVSRNRL
jgi:hypothetical protein